jgi:hypothetical protein
VLVFCDGSSPGGIDPFLAEPKARHRRRTVSGLFFSRLRCAARPQPSSLRSPLLSGLCARSQGLVVRVSVDD